MYLPDSVSTSEDSFAWTPFSSSHFHQGTKIITKYVCSLEDLDFDDVMRLVLVNIRDKYVSLLSFNNKKGWWKGVVNKEFERTRRGGASEERVVEKK